jgi:hypothetical protein
LSYVQTSLTTKKAIKAPVFTHTYLYEYKCMYVCKYVCTVCMYGSFITTVISCFSYHYYIAATTTTLLALFAIHCQGYLCNVCMYVCMFY